MQIAPSTPPQRPVAVDTVRVYDTTRVLDTVRVRVPVVDTVAVVATPAPGLAERAQLFAGLLGLPIAAYAAYAAWRTVEAGRQQARLARAQHRLVEVQFEQARQLYARSTAAAFVAAKARVHALWILAEVVDKDARYHRLGSHELMKQFVADVAVLMREDAGTLASVLGHDSDEWLGMQEVANLAHQGAVRGVWPEADLGAFYTHRTGFRPFLTRVEDRLDGQLAQALRAAAPLPVLPPDDR